jgi:hypothetical protein
MKSDLRISKSFILAISSVTGLFQLPGSPTEIRRESLGTSDLMVSENVASKYSLRDDHELKKLL